MRTGTGCQITAIFDQFQTFHIEIKNTESNHILSGAGKCDMMRYECDADV